MMYKEAIYHRPKANFAYALDENTLQIMLRTRKDDIDSIDLVYGDPYDWKDEKWQSDKMPMKKSGSTDIFDYWTVQVTPDFRRLRYGFYCKNENDAIYYTERGFFHELPARSEERRVGKECRWRMWQYSERTKSNEIRSGLME